ncbi:GNAT family N-acetyltransferase [Streptomyces sp. NPDC094154]|uniref:GNAT family N-acetyltransferase n=1 Tax=Streptomyces sp. NPDC094154 TaxID=3366059 RepID=UPI003811547B
MTVVEPSEVAFERGGRDLAVGWFRQICALHDAVFSVEPFAWAPEMSFQHREELGSLMMLPGFRLTIARQRSQLVGYIYGHPLAVDHGWWLDFTHPVPGDLVKEWEGRTFAVISLGVRTEWRGHGVGKRLMGELLRDRTEQRAILSVQPTAVSTQRFYRHLGWRKTGRKGPLHGVTPPYWDIYLRELNTPHV